jgi:hypothetical protein
VGTQSSTKGVQGFDQVIIFFTEFFLRNRKNGLASMKAIHEKVHGLFLHLQLCHLHFLLSH